MEFKPIEWDVQCKDESSSEIWMDDDVWNSLTKWKYFFGWKKHEPKQSMSMDESNFHG